MNEKDTVRKLAELFETHLQFGDLSLENREILKEIIQGKYAKRPQKRM
jgi:hypothetical protein